MIFSSDNRRLLFTPILRSTFQTLSIILTFLGKQYFIESRVYLPIKNVTIWKPNANARSKYNEHQYYKFGKQCYGFIKRLGGGKKKPFINERFTLRRPIRYSRNRSIYGTTLDIIDIFTISFPHAGQIRVIWSFAQFS